MSASRAFAPPWTGALPRACLGISRTASAALHARPRDGARSLVRLRRHPLARNGLLHLLADGDAHVQASSADDAAAATPRARFELVVRHGLSFISRTACDTQTQLIKPALELHRNELPLDRKAAEGGGAIGASWCASAALRLLQATTRRRASTRTLQLFRPRGGADRPARQDIWGRAELRGLTAASCLSTCIADGQMPPAIAPAHRRRRRRCGCAPVERVGFRHQLVSRRRRRSCGSRGARGGAGGGERRHEWLEMADRAASSSASVYRRRARERRRRSRKHVQCTAALGEPAVP